MAGLQDLRKYAEEGLIKLDSIRKKNIPKTGSEVAEIANKMSNAIMADYHSFVKDQRAAFLRRVDESIERIEKKQHDFSDTVKNLGGQALVKCESALDRADYVKQNVEEALKGADQFFHEEKERVINDIRLAEGSVKDKIIKVSEELDAIRNEAEGLVGEAVSKVESIDEAISNGRKYLDEVAAEMRESMKIEMEKHRDKFIYQFVDYFVKNFLSIVWRWVKGLFRKNK